MGESTVVNRISSAAVDHSVTEDESVDIRQRWDRLKSFAEAFVRGCENGDFKNMPRALIPPAAK
jgi:hypothetical protein